MVLPKLLTKRTTSSAAHIQPYVIHIGAAPTLSLPYFYTRYHRALWPPGPSQLAFSAVSSNYNDQVNEVVMNWSREPAWKIHTSSGSITNCVMGGRWFNLSGLSEPAAVLRPHQERWLQSEKLTHVTSAGLRSRSAASWGTCARHVPAREQGSIYWVVPRDEETVRLSLRMECKCQ